MTRHTKPNEKLFLAPLIEHFGETPLDEIGQREIDSASARSCRLPSGRPTPARPRTSSEWEKRFGAIRRAKDRALLEEVERQIAIDEAATIAFEALVTKPRTVEND